MYLLDTNIISELRRRRPHGGVVSWLSSIESNSLSISVSSIYEIQAGIELTRLSDLARATELEIWLAEVEASYRVLAATPPVARLWAKLMHRRMSILHQDALIAATAIVHGMTVVTRNTADFEPFAVPIFNPFTFRD